MIISKFPRKTEEPYDIANATINGTYVSYAGGSTIYLASTLVVSYGGRVLSSSDYTLSGTTSAKEPGTYYATITGKGIYTGAKSVVWYVNRIYANSCTYTVVFNGITILDHVTNPSEISATVTPGDYNSVSITATWDAPEDFVGTSEQIDSGIGERNYSRTINGKTITVLEDVSLWSGYSAGRIRFDLLSAHYRHRLVILLKA